MKDSLSSQFVQSITPNFRVKDEFEKSITIRRPRSRISVTDLVNPMQSFFSRTRPDISPSPDRLQVMMAGTGFHEVFCRLVSTEEHLEQLLEFEGIVGKVDIYDDVPIELKTTSSIPKDIYKGRNSYLEQLGMYCAMAGKETGQLFIYQRKRDWQENDFKVFGVSFRNLEHIYFEMRSRRDIFLDALSRNDPSRLPQCKWLHLGCDYSDVCPCPDQPLDNAMISPEDVEITDMPTVAEDILDKSRPVHEPEQHIRLNDLVFPRKASFRIHQSDSTHNTPGNLSRMKELQRQGFWYELANAVRKGSPGESRFVPVSLSSLNDSVSLYRDIPLIIRVPVSRKAIHPDNLLSFFSHYFDRLAFECALTNIRHGQLALYYERVPNEKFMVFDVTFHSRDAILNEARRRLKLLETASEYTSLPECPSWMVRLCEYTQSCRCGERL